MSSLAEKLSSLGFRKGSEVVAPSKTRNKPALVDVLNGKIIENDLGKVVVVEKLFPYGYFHGDIQFVEQIDASEIHKTTKVNSYNNNLQNIVFLDTETTGLAGGTGTLAFLIGVGRFNEQGFCLTQFVLEDPSEEPALLLALSVYSESIEGLITFNGKSFDMPLLKTRFILNKLPIPFGHWGHLDLLHLSRRIWRQRLPNRSLKDLEQNILHLPRSEEEVPGWMIPEIYFNYLRTGDAASIGNVVYHNAMDIVSLSALFIAITQMLDKDLFTEKMNPLDVFSIGQVYENIGETGKAIEIYEYCLKNNNLVNGHAIDLNARLGNLYKKQSNWDHAKLAWERNTNNGDFDSCVELAKYYEHEMKDQKKALLWTDKAELINLKVQIPNYKKKMRQKELMIRKCRLEKRINSDV